MEGKVIETYAIPIVDLFAGPGGLNEGFSSVRRQGERVFDVRLSVEKDTHAHKTLELRSFVRKFARNKVPKEYYDILKETSIPGRERLRQLLFESYPREALAAKEEAWLAELGATDFPSHLIDSRISKRLNNANHWVLIGGPPCQAYSLVGRSRVGGIDEEDHRVYLYKEYLRIIAAHHPSVFIMENVKGLLSARISEERVFDMMLRDLQNPSSVFPEITSPRYKIYSLATEATEFDLMGAPIYRKDKMYLIQAEKYGVPQKRHRVILLGIRDDIDVIPTTLNIREKACTLREVINDLPKIRSRLSRSFISSEIVDGKKKRHYRNMEDTSESWLQNVKGFRKEIIAWNGFATNYSDKDIKLPINDSGAEFVKCDTPSIENPLYEWYRDPQIDGACNHISRSHLLQDLKRYMFSSMFANVNNRFPKLEEFKKHSAMLLPDHKNVNSGKFADRFRVQMPDKPATTVTSHISKDGHYFIHYDADQCRSLTVREAARIQTFPDNYLFCGSRSAQYHQVGNAVPPYLAMQIGEIVLKIFEEIYNSSKK